MLIWKTLLNLAIVAAVWYFAIWRIDDPDFEEDDEPPLQGDASQFN